MASVPNVTQIPPPRMQVVDPRTGLITREWYLWFLNLFTLTGSGSNPVSLEDLLVGPENGALAEALALMGNDDALEATALPELDARLDGVERAVSILPSAFNDAAILEAIAGLQVAPLPQPTLTLAYGAYTPALSGAVNLDSSTSLGAQWLRVGGCVTVSGMMNLDPTAIGADTRIEIELPVPSDFANAFDCNGVASNVTAQQAGGIYGEATNNTALLRFFSNDNGNRGWTYTFTYRLP